MTTPLRTRVAIVGAGPAGLLLSHLLHREGIESIVIDSRTRAEIESTIRAGILEQGTVELLTSSGASERVLVDGHRHDGIELHLGGEAHRIDFADLVGRAVWLYPQHEVLKDLVATRLADSGDIRFGWTASAVRDPESDTPRVVGTDAEGPSSRSSPTLWSEPMDRAASPARPSPVRRADTSASTRSAGSGSSARRHRARRS